MSHHYDLETQHHLIQQAVIVKRLEVALIAHLG
jgi:hypothetical protein